MTRRLAGPAAIDPALVQAAIDESRESGRDLVHLSLNRVARRAGISRATLFRRIGGREALEEAVRSAGVDPGRKDSVRERALVAALDLIETRGLEALTLEAVARRAGCALTSLHTQLGGREGLLSAVFERYSPIAGVERILDNRPERFEDQVRAVYGVFFDVAVRRGAVGGALFAHAVGSPDGPIADFVRETIVPRVLKSIGGWLTEEARKGNCRELPQDLVVPLLLGPFALHMLSRTMIERAGGEPPDRATVIDTMTEVFCRGVTAARL